MEFLREIQLIDSSSDRSILEKYNVRPVSSHFDSLNLADVYPVTITVKFTFFIIIPPENQKSKSDPFPSLGMV